jgi:hypothetical protein
MERLAALPGPRPPAPASTRYRAGRSRPLVQRASSGPEKTATAPGTAGTAAQVRSGS